MKYRELVTVVGKILSDLKQKPLHFDELKKKVEEEGTIDDDLFLEQVLIEMRGRGTVSFDRTIRGNLVNIRWNRKKKPKK